MRSRSIFLTALMPLSVSLMVIACGGGNGGDKKVTATKAPSNPNDQSKAKSNGSGGRGGSAASDSKNWKTRAMEAKLECASTVDMTVATEETKLEAKSLKDNQSGTWELVETQLFSEVVDLNDKTNKAKIDQISGESTGSLDLSFVDPKFSDEALHVTCYTSNIQKLVKESIAKDEASAAKSEEENKNEATAKETPSIIPIMAGAALPQSIDRKTGKVSFLRRDIYKGEDGKVSGSSTLAKNESTVEKLFVNSAGSTFVITKLGDKLIIRGETVKLIENTKSMNKTIRFRGVYEAK